MAGEPIGAEEQDVACFQRFLKQINFGRAFGTETVQDDVAPGMKMRFFFGDGPFFHQFGHQALIFGDLADTAVAPQIATTVPHIGNVGMIFSEGNRYHGRSHAAVVVSLQHILAQLRIGSLHGV